MRSLRGGLNGSGRMERGAQRAGFASRSTVPPIYVVPVKYYDLLPNGSINYFTGKLGSLTFGNTYPSPAHPRNKIRFIKQKSLKRKN